MFNLKLSFASVVLASLVACGGGGGGGDSTAQAPNPAVPIEQPPVVPPSTVGTLQNSAPAPTYAENTGELAAFNYFQNVRTSCGFGAVIQNTKLDTAALAHSNYLLAGSTENQYLTGHFETDTNNPFFRGNAPADRAAAANYGSLVREILSSSIQMYGTNTPPVLLNEKERGLDAMRSLVNTVGHLQDALSGARTVGYGDDSRVLNYMISGVPATTDHYRFASLLGSQEGKQLLGAGQVASYPCAASQDVEYAFHPANESPNPFPEITDTNTQVGPPIYLRADAGAVLTIATKSLKDSAGSEVPVRTEVGPLGAHEFFMVPASKLQPGSVYTVNITGTANGAAFVRAFTFKTKS